MTRLLCSLAVVAMMGLPPAPASADQDLSQLQHSARRVLHAHNIRANVHTLSPAQLSAIHAIGHGNRSHGSRRSLLRSTISGQGYRLRDLFVRR